jgi:hypothetical protein
MATPPRTIAGLADLLNTFKQNPIAEGPPPSIADILASLPPNILPPGILPRTTPPPPLTPPGGGAPGPVPITPPEGRPPPRFIGPPVQAPPPEGTAPPFTPPPGVPPEFQPVWTNPALAQRLFNLLGTEGHIRPHTPEAPRPPGTPRTPRPRPGEGVGGTAARGGPNLERQGDTGRGEGNLGVA